MVLPSLRAVDAAAWDALAADDHPFIRHAYLRGLEVSGTVGVDAAAGVAAPVRRGLRGQDSRWVPMHLLVLDDDSARRLAEAGSDDALPEGSLHPLAAAPCYAKADSWGEYIFDFQWAEFFRSHGRAYYPKLVIGVPFTPATGRRLLVARGQEAAQRRLLADAALALARQIGASSVHVLFCTDEEAEALATAGYARRATLQYQWHARGERCFDDVLAGMRAPSRKAIRRERKIAHSHGLRLDLVRGDALSERDWRDIHRLYVLGCVRYGSAPYLQPGFFDWLRTAMPERVLCGLARDANDTIVAMTLNFREGDVLYGRYWGSDDDWPMLHFELAYYALIDHAVAEGLRRVEAGSGGEHKLKRGLEPTICHSAHAVLDARLAGPIVAFLERERSAVATARDEISAQGTRPRGAGADAARSGAG